MNWNNVNKCFNFWARVFWERTAGTRRVLKEPLQRQNVARSISSCANFLFLPHFHVICDLLRQHRIFNVEILLGASRKTSNFCVTAQIRIASGMIYIQQLCHAFQMLHAWEGRSEASFRQVLPRTSAMMTPKAKQAQKLNMHASKVAQSQPNTPSWPTPSKHTTNLQCDREKKSQSSQSQTNNNSSF